MPHKTEVDFYRASTTLGTQTAGGLVLTLVLPPGMHLLGSPAYERGSGGRGPHRSSASTLSCIAAAVSMKSTSSWSSVSE